ncbi:Uma2 family endonuclease, partial [Actinoplanes subtropicus]|uniref:Uma2 family endonuclease n=1 Tax=Actinoplanes subtropicus TaxID=543632 RepID=UPI0012FB4942
MTTSIFSHGLPMSEQEFLNIGETPERIELFDGSLHVTPSPTPRHQLISRRLANALDIGAQAADLQVLEAVNVRLAPDRIPIPDLAITADIDLDELVIDAGDVHLVCEILSPSNQATDKVLKMHYYAAAGIVWYLLVDPGARSLHLYRLAGNSYVEHAAGKDGDALRPRPFQDHDVIPRMAKGLVMFRPAHRVASVMSRR